MYAGRRRLGNGEGSSRYTVYFYAQFSKPLKDYGVWSVDIPAGQDRHREFVESPAFQTLTANAKISERPKAYEGVSTSGSLRSLRPRRMRRFFSRLVFPL